VLGLLESHFEVLNVVVEGGAEFLQLGRLQVLDLDVTISDVIKNQFVVRVEAPRAAGAGGAGHREVGTFPRTTLNAVAHVDHFSNGPWTD
jgi:hypothetical protein